MQVTLEQLPEFLTAKDLEALLQIDRKTIYAYVQRGLIPYIRVESNVRFAKHQVLEWLEERSFQKCKSGFLVCPIRLGERSRQYGDEEFTTTQPLQNDLSPALRNVNVVVR